MDIQEEEFTIELYFEMLPLLKRHYDEIAHFKDIHLAPDLETYFALKRADQLRVYTVRSDGMLVGYEAFFIRPHMHYIHSKVAQQDVIFIDKYFRKKGLGRSLRKVSDYNLKAMGVQVVARHVKDKHNFGPALEQDGHELMDLIYVKRLDLV